MIKRIIKYLAGAILVLILVGILGLQWVMRWSPQAQEAWENVSNSEKLQLGMTTSDLIKIMGEPDNLRVRENEIVDSVYYYQPPFAASSGIDIVVKDDSIKKINYYEGN